MQIGHLIIDINFGILTLSFVGGNLVIWRSKKQNIIVHEEAKGWPYEYVKYYGWI